MTGLIEEIEGLSGPQGLSDEAWEKFLQDLNNPQSLQNQGRPKPRAIDLDTEE